MMKKLLRCAIFVPLIAMLISCSNESPKIPNYDGYELMFNDDFDGETLNEEYWEYMIGDGSPNVGWGNSELEYYTKENVSIKDSKLIITAKREDKGGYHFTSARIRSKGKVFTTYGRIEALISLPEKTAMWPAFWMLPETNYQNKGWPWSGEIDIMEARGRVNDMYTGAVHVASSSGSDNYQVVSYSFNGEGRSAKEGPKTYISDYHLYSLEWDEDELRWLCDNELVGTVPARFWRRNQADGTIYDPFTKDFHLLLNLAVGGNFDNNRTPDDDFESAEMKIDYVRVYTFKK